MRSLCLLVFLLLSVLALSSFSSTAIGGDLETGTPLDSIQPTQPVDPPVDEMTQLDTTSQEESEVVADAPDEQAVILAPRRERPELNTLKPRDEASSLINDVAHLEIDRAGMDETIGNASHLTSELMKRSSEISAQLNPKRVELFLLAASSCEDCVRLSLKLLEQVADEQIARNSLSNVQALYRSITGVDWNGTPDDTYEFIRKTKEGDLARATYYRKQTEAEARGCTSSCSMSVFVMPANPDFYSYMLDRVAYDQELAEELRVAAHRAQFGK